MKPVAFGLVWLALSIPLMAWAVGAKPPHRHLPAPLEQAQQPPLLDYVPKYHEHVKPILERACVGCHQSGEIAPFSLETPELAVQHARAMQLAVQSKQMPPWLPNERGMKFLNERKLTDAEIAIIANWAWAGAPLGKKPSVDNAPQRAAWQPDLTLDTGREFATDARLTDEWRCFLVEPKLEQARFMTAFNIRASNPRIVHHVGLFQVTKRGIEQAKMLEAKSGARGGYPCLGSAGVESRGIGLIGFWLPGNGAVRLPENTGIRLEPEDGLVLQLHYNTQNGGGTDRTRAELVLAPANNPPKQPLRLNAFIAQPEIPCAGPYPSDSRDPCHRDAAYDEQSQLEVLTFGEQGKQLNAGFRLGFILDQCGRTVREYTQGSSGQDITATCTQTLIPADKPERSNTVELRFLLPHMHFLGSQYKLELLRGGKSTVLLEIPRWDFHWQNGYFLAEPIPVQAGDVLRHTCTYDNSPEHQPVVNGVQRQPRYVVWGERSFDEMCVTVFGFTPK